MASAWEVTAFGKDLSSILKLNSNIPIPVTLKDDQVLVKVMASSINPIDILMSQGYAATVMQLMREKAKGRYMASILLSPARHPFPIILGRDFAGIVSKMGNGVKNFKLGQEVYGVVYVAVAGSHAEYVVVDQNWIQPKPDFLSFSEAASIPYVGLTTWCALRNAGGFLDFTGQNFLVLGGSGGVGTFAIQYLKRKGAQVTTTCSPTAFKLMKELGADYTVDYKDPAFLNLLELHAPYDCIYDLSGLNGGGLKTLPFGRRGTAKYVTLRSPAAYNIEKYGLFFGGLKTIFDLLTANISSWYHYRVSVKWGFVIPDGQGWKEVAELVKAKKIKPVVQQVYKYADLPAAYEMVEKGHLLGKIVIEV